MSIARTACAALLALVVSSSVGLAPAAAYPPGDGAYLDYAEMVASIEQIAARGPSIAELFSIGRSYQGRELWAAKVSDNVGADEEEPEVVFDGGMHAREHMTTEMAVALFRNLVDGYGVTPRVTDTVNQTEIFIIFNLNPDGSEYDHQSGIYQMWRKNRQPTPGSTEIGTDINRNFGYQWGTNPLNASPSGETYRGPSAWSTPEASAFKRFVDGRVIGGVQQVSVHVTFHQYGRIVLYPYGYTTTAIPSDMTAADHDVLVAMAAEMARRSGYAYGQSAHFTRNVGNQMDWMYATHGVMSFTLEMGDEFYMPPSAILTETERNMDAAYYAIEQAGCPHAVTGRAAQHCPPDWVSRLAGNDRYATSAAISRATFPSGVPVAYIATGQAFPDALAGGVAAGLDEGPLLLVQRDRIPAAVAAELHRLAPGRIVVIGGSAVISSSVQDELHPYTSGAVTRVSGADRYATAAAISRRAFPFDPPPVAFVATGADFPDGLAAVPAAVSAGGPLLLVQHGQVPASTAEELDRLEPGRIVVLGGTSVVSAAVQSALQVYTSGSVTRIAGADRYATAAEIARIHFPGHQAEAYLASGEGFADAMSGGPAAVIDGAPLLLTMRNRLPASTAARLDVMRPTELVVLGGTAVISAEAAAAGAIAAR